ncbi:glycoside hydrolase family 73 protein [Streptococcus suis]|uniref:glycoside hydrolase family 73 protein n=1 Tax=Streptococcus suis TaxID=1307 RepID=UPI002AAB5BA6|nr:glycoside hydrolase family 73 protein [Streptococcus suis]
MVWCCWGKVDNRTQALSVNQVQNLDSLKSKPRETSIQLTETQKKFLESLKPFVKKVANTTGIAPSVIFAQAILESAWGTSTLAKEANNFFGIKADEKWQGKSMVHETKEVRDGKVITITAKFRAYNNQAESVQDYGQFFTSNPWRIRNYYHFRNSTNYLDAVIALQRSGYATDPTYAEKLKSVIERYSLDRIEF